MQYFITLKLWQLLCSMLCYTCTCYPSPFRYVVPLLDKLASIAGLRYRSVMETVWILEENG